jgi:two-component system sensor histidine kinase DegS
MPGDVGFDPLGRRRPDQQGLRGMRERMELLGGTLSIESRLGEGSGVLARIPLAAEEEP